MWITSYNYVQSSIAALEISSSASGVKGSPKLALRCKPVFGPSKPSTSRVIFGPQLSTSALAQDNLNSNASINSPASAMSLYEKPISSVLERTSACSNKVRPEVGGCGEFEHQRSATTTSASMEGMSKLIAECNLTSIVQEISTPQPKRKLTRRGGVKLKKRLASVRAELEAAEVLAKSMGVVSLVVWYMKCSLIVV